MPVTLSKLRGEAIPVPLRGPDVEVVYRVVDAAGQVHDLLDEVEAAQLAVRASDPPPDPPG
ncbi:hypothetical protein [Pseudomonas sp.]|uniref:hypothetical protein n=1 Tax=Pseudomonas sp. TaxID=306 RepID=UPI0028A63169|nr:hypothetical protein [Pseudomonas sp.]